MKESVWESEYLDVYDYILLNSDIYLTVRDFHVKAMNGLETVLDSGSGTGNVTLELLKKDHDVYVIDNSQKSLEILKKRCKQFSEKLHIFNINAKSLLFEDNKFDGITSMFVVYYIDDIGKYLRENYRVLKPNGVLALTGRVSSKDMELVLKSYEESLKKRGLLSKMGPEFSKFKKRFLENVTESVISGNTFEETKDKLERIGFMDIKQYPNPYFGQCYSLTAKK